MDWIKDVVWSSVWAAEFDKKYLKKAGVHVGPKREYNNKDEGDNLKTEC